MRATRCYRIADGAVAERLKLDVSSRFPRLLVQTADQTAASNESFVEMLTAQTTQAMASGNLLARKPEVDLLLRLAGTTQISEAIRDVGARAGSVSLLILVGEENELEELEAAKTAIGGRLRKTPLTSEELLKVEKAALLNAIRA